MPGRAQHRYDFGGFCLDASERLLYRDGTPVTLTPKALEILLVLVQNHGHIVEKDELMNQVWPGTFVEEGNLTFNIHQLRKLLGGHLEEFIETIPRRGYRFVFPVKESSEPSSRPERKLAPTAITADGALVQQAEVRRFRVQPVATLLALLAATILILGLPYVRSHRRRPPSPPAHNRIVLAVLPFENLTGDSNQGFFSQGLTEELITDLSRLQPGRLGVIARTSVMRYQKSPKSTRDLGRELGVQYVLEGSVRRGGDHLRITTQLIQVSDETHVWAASYDKQSAGDILAIQTQIAESVAKALELELLPADRARLAPATPVNPSAYESYLRGRFYWNQRTRGGIEKGIEHFQAAIEQQPDFALAHAGLAESYAVLGFYSNVPSRETLPKARAAAKRALAADNRLAEAHAVLGYVNFFHDWDWPAAENEFRRAIELNPNYATAHQWYGEFLRLMGRYEEGLRESRRAAELDPLSVIIQAELGLPFYYMRRHDEAAAQLRKALEIAPDSALVHAWLAATYRESGRLEESFLEWQEARRLDASPWVLSGIAVTYARAGKTTEARQFLKDLGRLAAQSRVSSYDLAQVHAALGDRDAALARLEQAYAEREMLLVGLNVDPLMDNLRQDPRFHAFLRRIRLA